MLRIAGPKCLNHKTVDGHNCQLIHFTKSKLLFVINVTILPLLYLSIHSYAAVSINKEVLFFGGYVGRYGEVATIAKFDTAHEWHHLGQLLERRHAHSAVITNHIGEKYAIIIGGEGKRYVTLKL